MIVERQSTPEAETRVRASDEGYLKRFLALQSDSPRRRSVFARVFGVHPLDRLSAAAYAGAAAELVLADGVHALGEGWTAFECTSTGSDRLSTSARYLLVGPPGVFTLSLYSHSGARVWVGTNTVLVDDVRFPYLADAERDADVVADLMRERSVTAATAPTITPCIIIANTAKIQFAGAARRVVVLQSAAVGEWLATLPRLQSPTAVTALATAALSLTRTQPLAHTRPLTHAQPLAHTRPLAHTQPPTQTQPMGECDGQAADRARFAEITRTVVIAGHRRLIWAVIGALASLAAFLATAAYFLSLPAHP